jgi:DNA-binding NtrC family response regulator
MRTLVWLGPLPDAQRLSQVLAGLGLTLVVASDVDEAIEAVAVHHAPAIVVAVEWSELPLTVARVSWARPEVQVLVGTRLGVPAHVSAALEAGASDLVDLKERDAAVVGPAIERALQRHRRAVRERELLEKLRELNEGFLKAMVAMDHRNQELEEVISGDVIDGVRRILVVDDEDALAGLVQMVLSDHGYDVVTARDGEQALRLFASQSFHLVLADKNMPVLDGLELLRRVKQLRPAVDVILMTAYGSKESAIAALNHGAAAYLEKPFDDVEDIARKVTAVLDAQRRRQRQNEFLRTFKERNKDFLEQYRSIRAELESWLVGEKT